MSPGHSTDEQLIAHLDGELSGLAARSVHRHVASCWQCRARMRELENQALRIAKALAADNFPGPERTAPAIARFDAWRNQVRVNPRPRGGSLRWITAAACIAIAGMIGLSRREAAPPAPAPPSDPMVWIRAVRATEESFARQAVHQTLDLEITSPETGRRATRLEVWSDAAHDRFAFEWRQPDGRLKQALWRPDGRRAARFDPVRDEGQASFVQLTASVAGLRQFEAALHRWLKSRTLAPVSLSANFAEFAGQDAVSVRMERIDARTTRLTAVRGTRELILDTDAATSRPRSLVLRVREAGRTMEFRLVSGRFETLRPDEVQASVFEPKLPGPLQVPEVPVAVAVVEAAPVPATPDFEAREIEVHFVLHRVRACLGDQIAVMRDAFGNVVVRGLVESAERKAEIFAAIQGLPDVKSEIETVDEAAGRRRAAGRPSQPAAIALQVDNATFPMRDRLEEHVGRAQVPRFASEAVSLSGSALAEAWAIHRLTQDFPAGRPDPLGLVKQMLQDHNAAFAAKVRHLRVLLGPLLPPVPAAVPEGAPAPLASAQRIDDLVRSLFSASHSSAEAAAADLERLAGALAATNLTHSTEREP